MYRVKIEAAKSHQVSRGAIHNLRLLVYTRVTEFESECVCVCVFTRVYDYVYEVKRRPLVTARQRLTGHSNRIKAVTLVPFGSSGSSVKELRVTSGLAE